MFKYTNVNPKGKITNDCVKRAIAMASGKDYHDVSIELNRYKKISGAEKFNEPKNYEGYIERVLSAKKKSFPAVAGQPRMNGAKFCEEFPKGSYILRMAGHLSACVDGVICDTWDCSNKCVYKAWKINHRENNCYCCL